MQKGVSLTFFHPDNELNFGCSLPLRGKVALEYTQGHWRKYMNERRKEGIRKVWKTQLTDAGLATINILPIYYICSKTLTF